MLHPSAHLLLHRGGVFRAQRGRLGELDLPARAGDEHRVDHATVEVDMRIQRAAEALLQKLAAPSHPRAQPLRWRTRASMTRNRMCSMALIA